MHVVIYGAGAIGGVIGAHLFASGTPTTLVARGAHLQAIREKGLILDTDSGLLVQPIPSARSAAEVDWTDNAVVLVCVKSQQTAAALDDLRAHAPSDIPIVSAQNGVVNEPALLRVFPRVYSVCVMLPAWHMDPGVVVQGSSAAPGILDVGCFPGGTDAVADELSERFRAASFPSRTRRDITAWKYRKLITNLGNGVDACYRDDGYARAELTRRARAEGEAVLAAAGIEAVSDATDKERRANHIQRRRSGAEGGGNSTWQSVERGDGTSEIDYLSGEIVLLGRLHGMPTPVNALVQSETARVVREHLAAESLDPVEALRGLDSAG
ncbi:ketopantoate reductase family protein [Gordonia sp. NPDC003504]